MPTDAPNSTSTVGETIRPGTKKQPSSFAKTSKKSAERAQFQSLDLLRIIASLMIVLFHAHSIASKNSLSHGEHFFPAPVWWYSCIELFFTMSGFLMIHMSKDLFGSRRGTQIFATRRAIRTPPLYWIYTLIFTAIFILRPTLSAQGPIDLRTFLCSIFFFPNIRPPIISIGWTLDYEVPFYFIIGASILFPYSKGWKIAIAALVSLVMLGQIFGPHASPWATWFDPMMLDFVVGILVAVAFHHRLLFGNLGTAILFCTGIGLILSYHRLANFDLMRAATMGVGMGCVVAAATLRKVPIVFEKYKSVIASLSSQTYTVYLCHILVLKAVELVFFRYFSGFLANCIYIVFGTVITLLVAKVLYEILERPLAASLRDKLKKHGLI